MPLVLGCHSSRFIRRPTQRTAIRSTSLSTPEIRSALLHGEFVSPMRLEEEEKKHRQHAHLERSSWMPHDRPPARALHRDPYTRYSIGD